MKAWIFSDLHMDVRADTHPFRLPERRPDHDMVIIAGDVREGAARAVRWIAETCLHHKPVIYVRGNHESYGKAIDTDLEAARAEIKNTSYPHNIHLLENDSVDIDGVRFIGATLWTDYALYGEEMRWACYTAAQAGMNDHRRIRVAANGYAKFRTKEAWIEHKVSRIFIEDKLAEPFDGPRVVVTHHAPSMKSIDFERFGHTPLNGAYASNLDHLIDRSELWVHGHVHTRFDYMRGNGRVICNPRGYVGAGEETGFDPALVVDIPEVVARSSEEGGDVKEVA
jgi:Icc-related predicted phosphoesterase